MQEWIEQRGVKCDGEADIVRAELLRSLEKCAPGVAYLKLAFDRYVYRHASIMGSSHGKNLLKMIRSMLSLDPDHRPTAEVLLSHPFIAAFAPGDIGPLRGRSVSTRAMGLR
jgi:hypothetical protein